LKNEVKNRLEFSELQNRAAKSKQQSTHGGTRVLPSEANSAGLLRSPNFVQPTILSL
jgi:hypothetical protein